jgi:hypothetical protein
MWLFKKARFSMATIMMFVVAAAAGSALFAKVSHHTGAVAPGAWKIDVPTMWLSAIGLTAVALAAWKEHTPIQTMLQFTLACLGCLVLVWIGEAQYERAIRYWFQGTFAATVVIPLLGRRLAKRALPRGPRRDWWKNNCEAVFFSFLNMMLVTAGGVMQTAVYVLGESFLSKSVAP